MSLVSSDRDAGAHAPEAETDPRPQPQPDEVTEFFWEGAREHRLLVQRCSRCTLFQYPPDIVCVHCQCTDLTPTEVTGKGSLYSYTVVARVFHQAFTHHLPYVVGLVELEEQSGLKMLTNIVDVDPRRVFVGMAVEVTFESRGDAVLPQFRPIENLP